MLHTLNLNILSVKRLIYSCNSYLQNGLVLISGLPEDEWSETDIEKLVQPFGTPSGMILAKQIGKVCKKNLTVCCKGWLLIN